MRTISHALITSTMESLNYALVAVLCRPWLTWKSRELAELDLYLWDDGASEY